MRKLMILVALMVTSLFLSIPRASAQVGPPGLPDMNDPDMQEMMQMGMQMFQRMQDSGIDMMSIGQQMQDGTFDADQFQQMLVDKGVIDNDMMNRMQKTGTRVILKTLKQQLESTDDEWTVLGPRLEKIFGAMMTLGNAGGAGSAPMMMMPNNTSAVAKAMKELKDELASPSTNEGKIFSRLKAYRDAVAKAREELKTARASLQGLLTLHQEVILMNMGLLE